MPRRGMKAKPAKKKKIHKIQAREANRMECLCGVTVRKTDRTEREMVADGAWSQFGTAIA
jgi:hypothetical protein